MDVRTSFIPMVPQDLSCCPILGGFEIVVCVSKLLGILFPVILTILKHLPVLLECMLRHHRWVRLPILAVANFHLILWQQSCSMQRNLSLRNTTRLMYFWNVLSNSEFLTWHEFTGVASLSTATFASGIRIAFGKGIGR